VPCSPFGLRIFEHVLCCADRRTVGFVTDRCRADSPFSASLAAGRTGVLAALEDIDQRRALDRFRDGSHFLGTARRLDKTDIGAGLEIGVSLGRWLPEALRWRAGVGARDDPQIAVAPRIHRRLDLADHFMSGGSLLCPRSGRIFFGATWSSRWKTPQPLPFRTRAPRGPR